MKTKIQLIHELWFRGDLSYKLDLLQLKIKETNADAKESLVLSSRQIGKSYEALVEAIEDCIKNPGIIVRFATDTYDHIQEIVEDNMTPICRDAPPGLVKQLKAAGRWRIGKSSLRLGSLEKAHVDSNRGGNAYKVILEEGGFVKSEDYKYAVESVFGPQLIRSNGKIKHITTVSEDEDHYIHTEILPKCELTNSVSRYQVYDSPSISLAQIDEAAKLCGGKDTPTFRREYLAIIERNLQTVIVPMFNKERHVATNIMPSHCNWILAWDMGGSRDLDACNLLYFDYERAKVVVKKNLVWQPGTNTRQIVAELKDLEESLGICKWGDDRKTPTELQSIFRYGDGPAKLLLDVSVDEKYHIVMPEKTNQPAAVNALDIAFSRDEIEIDPECVHLISSLTNGKWNKQRTDFERTKALGHFDSGMALVYAYRHVNKKNPFPSAPVNRDLQLRIKPSQDISDEQRLSQVFDKTRPRIQFKRR